MDQPLKYIVYVLFSILSVVSYGQTGSGNVSETPVIFQETSGFGIGNAITITLKAEVFCNGKVKFSFEAPRNLKNLKVTYSGGSGATFLYSTESVTDEENHWIIDQDWYVQGNTYSWEHYEPNASNYKTVNISFKYKSGAWYNAGVGLTYGVPGNIETNLPHYSYVEVSPNNYEFIYEGASLNNTYKFYSDVASNIFYQANDLINGQKIWTNSQYSVENPVFYCRDDNSSNYSINTKLTYDKVISVANKTLTCTAYWTEPAINLGNLCDYLNPPTISPGQNEFRPIIHTGNLDDASLAPFVTSHKINYNWQSGQSGNSTVQFDQNYTANYGNTHGNKTIKEFVTFKGGCTCEMVTTYNTNNPCMNMSGLSFTVVYDEGENHFEFTPAHYEGSASLGTPTSVQINFGDGSPSVFPTTLDPIAHDFPGNGPYTVTQITTFPGFPPCTTSVTMTQDIILNNEYCCENFSLDNATTAYWISAWVMEGHAIQPKTYQNSYIEIEFLGGGTTVQPYQFQPTGDIIEGWQRIVGKFSIPTGAVKMNIHLASSGGSVDSYFDDVRVHPFNASMKSYVYDAETFWLTAELDDNNYATIYEYDNEGQLIRIKKETARGIMTIQESRSSNVIKYQE